MKNSLIAFTGGVVGSFLFSLIGWWAIPLVLWFFPSYVLCATTEFKDLKPEDRVLAIMLCLFFWPFVLFILNNEEWKEIKDFLGIPNIKLRSPFYIDKDEN